MSKKKDDHTVWTEQRDFHRKKEKDIGCIWRHASPPNSDFKGPCDYRWNGFQASRKRTDMYNNPHYDRAFILGYVDTELQATGKARGMIRKAGRQIKGKGEVWVDRYHEFFFEAPLYWLQADWEKGWHICHKIATSIQRAGPIRPKHRDRIGEENFKPRDNGGIAAYFPYYHQHHHMIPQGAFRDFVIYGEGDVEPAERIKIVLKSRWNINEPDNIVMLPKEEFIADIVMLPSHQPYGFYGPDRFHQTYSKSLKMKLDDVRNKIDEAVKGNKDGRHKEVKDIKIDLKVLEDELLEQIKEMEPGAQIGAVT